MDAVPEDGGIFVLLQLTQPFRADGLLKQAVDAAAESGLVVISATLMPDESWRRLDADGCWGARDGDADAKVYDGRIYVWRRDQLDEQQSRTARHAVLLETEDDRFVDIDWERDLPSCLRTRARQG